MQNTQVFAGCPDNNVVHRRPDPLVEQIVQFQVAFHDQGEHEGETAKREYRAAGDGGPNATKGPRQT